jgi:uncharacterized membrane protein/protein-disulfide isomerase
MAEFLTVDAPFGRRLLTFLSGAGMIAASLLTIEHFFSANFPESIFKGSFCDINAFLNCNASAYSKIAQFGGVPLGYFGLIAGVLVSLGALFPSRAFERTNRFLSLVNAVGVIFLLGYSVLYLKTLCLLCTGYYLFSFLSFYLFWRFSRKGEKPGLLPSFLSPSLKHIVVFALFAAAGASGYHSFYLAKQEAQIGGVSARVIKEYYSLEKVPDPSFISPFWTAQATERFEDAPIRVIEYADFLCSDCLFLFDELNRLKEDFRGKINIAFQFFPLEASCNAVVDKNLHPGACDLALIAAYDPSKFLAIHDEIFSHFQEARNPRWRAELAKKYGVEAALMDPATKAILEQIVNTGAEYEKTSEKYAHGIRSTPTLIVNNRMIIGTLPYDQLKSIFESLLVEQERGGEKKFIENWVEFHPKKK